MTGIAQLIRDLRVFSDPATEFSVDESSDILRVQMIRDGSSRTYIYNKKTGEVQSRQGKSRRFSSVAALLASDEFVDVRSFRATQRRMLDGKMSGDFIEPEGQLFKDARAKPLTLRNFLDATTRRSSNRLSILLLDGPAGIGKTSLIERVVYERADLASNEPPLLHVTSGGSRLTDLTKALAHATQVLRSRITFDQVPILVRYGVLQVAIDGFDELVDPDGYKDAWSALRNFLGEVRVGGPIILSGRDTFFDQQSFEEKLAARVPNLELAHARLYPVAVDTAKEFLRRNGWSDQHLAEAEANGWLRKGSYYLRPFFLVQLATKEGWQELAESHGSPQSFLVTRFVNREAKLVSSMVEIDQETAEEALWEFYGLIVEDMANQESDWVDEAFIALACEAAFQSRVSSSDLSKLVFKAASFGLLESEDGGASGLRRFPHSELQAQFLARVVTQGLESSAAVSVFLRRGLVSTALIDAFSDLVETMCDERVGGLRARLLRLIEDEPLAARLISNCGALLLATLSRPDVPTLELRSVSITDAKIVGTAGNALLREVSIAHLDARGADCRAIVFERCTVPILTVDALTVFGSTRPQGIRALQIMQDSGALQTLRVPEEIEQWLNEHSAAHELETANDSNLPFVRYFDRLCRKFVRQHQIRANPNDEGYFLIRHEYWNDVRALLGDRIVSETKAASGPRSEFYRMINPDALLAPPPGDIESAIIREKVIRRARELAGSA